MLSNELFNDIRTFGMANANPDIVAKYRRYFKEGYDAYGLTSDLVEAKKKSILETPGVDLQLVLSTGPLLLQTGKYEDTSMALLLLKAFHKQFSRETFDALGRWFDTGITNWAHTDFTCGDIIFLFFKKGIITYHDLDKWRTSHSRFKRRAVPVSLIKLLKTSENYLPFFEFIDPMMTDPAREVHQGLGWFMREAWKRQPLQAEEFLLKWKNTAPKLIFQYATEKMTPEGKQRFRREK
jgi:3-methyladenine DNA glycosylase AlkD